MSPPANTMRRSMYRRAQKVARAAVNFTEFVETVARDERGNTLKLAPHHLAWHRHVDYCWSHGLHAGIMAPWGHGKTSSMCGPLIAWMLGRDPNRRLKVICNADDAAADRVKVVAKILLSPTYRRIFPAVYPGGPWTKHQLFVNRPGWSQEASVDAKGVLSTGVGGRADILIFDDCVDQKNAREEAVRKHVRELIQETWMSRLEPAGLALWIATPWHLSDATHNLMVQTGWCFLVQRINADLTGIEQEVSGAGPDYPGAIIAGQAAAR